MGKKDERVKISDTGFNPEQIGRYLDDFKKKLEERKQEDLVGENERLEQIITDLQRVQKDQQEKIADMQERINGYLEEIRIYEHERDTLRYIIIDALKKEYP
jgi:uncharacterized membrane-anchored protein YjiN (DUF445 family)